jgi:uncharacterized protein (DUF2235 family)
MIVCGADGLSGRSIVKRLVVFFDGTWNKPGQEDEITNVVKLQRAVLAADANGVRQLVHYVVGIATEEMGPQLTFAVGAIGIGVGDRIRRGYTFLCENYEAGDEIYIIGFSRGAFQARSLAGLIALAGIARSAAPETITGVWNYYEQNKRSPDTARLEALRAAAHYPVRIKCVGVWDTVGNLGIPFMRKGLINKLLGFHDTQLSPLVDVGLHALAIDEPRGPFEPTFWTVKKGETVPEGQIIEQVWFPGSHANVGGGGKDSALSDIALLWMAERISQTTGLAIDLEHLRTTTRPNPMGELVSPTSDGVYRVSYVFPFVRLIDQNRKGVPATRRALFGNWRVGIAPAGQVIVNESIHESAIARFGKRAPLRRGQELRRPKYRPKTLAAALRKRKRAARRGA